MLKLSFVFALKMRIGFKKNVKSSVSTVQKVKKNLLFLNLVCILPLLHFIYSHFSFSCFTDVNISDFFMNIIYTGPHVYTEKINNSTLNLVGALKK